MLDLRITKTASIREKKVKVHGKENTPSVNIRNVYPACWWDLVGVTTGIYHFWSRGNCKYSWFTHGAGRRYKYQEDMEDVWGDMAAMTKSISEMNSVKQRIAILENELKYLAVRGKEGRH
jgi:hypothetical protein